MFLFQLHVLTSHSITHLLILAGQQATQVGVPNVPRQPRHFFLPKHYSYQFLKKIKTKTEKFERGEEEDGVMACVVQKWRYIVYMAQGKTDECWQQCLQQVRTIFFPCGNKILLRSIIVSLGFFFSFLSFFPLQVSISR